MINSRSMGTKSDGELSKFLQEEIQTEKKTRDVGGGEQVMITLNVNHTVDSAQPDDGTEEAPEMLSKPNFEVDLIKPGGKTLSFTCSYVYPENNPEAGQEEGLDDLFAIDEVTMFEGDNHSDSCYAVAGDILDGYMYDLLMTMLGRGELITTLQRDCPNGAAVMNIADILTCWRIWKSGQRCRSTFTNNIY